MKKDKSLHIVFTGGGTLGPVTPLLAVKEAWQKSGEDIRFSWIGTLSGPEKSFLSRFSEMAFYSIFAPKLSRHQKWRWIFIPFGFLGSLIWSWILLRKLRPDILYTAGGYVSVPLFIVGRLMGIPLWVHQLDVLPGLANRVMAKFATRISTTFPNGEHMLGGVCLGGLVRSMEGSVDRGYLNFNLDPQKPTVLMLGGGTGAQRLNEAMLAIKGDLLEYVNIVHSFGRGKMPDSVQAEPGYYPTELLTDDLAHAYACADILVARGGLGTLLEAVYWQLPMIMIPIEGSHQEENARLVEESQAGLVLRGMNPQMLLNAICKFAENRLEREAMARNMSQLVNLGAEEVIVEESKQII